MVRRLAPFLLPLAAFAAVLGMGGPGCVGPRPPRVGAGGEGAFAPFEPRAAAADDRRPCDDLLAKAKALIDEAERTRNARLAKDAIALLVRAEGLCPNDPEPPFWRVIAAAIAGDFDAAQSARNRVWAIRADLMASLHRPATDADSDPWVLVSDAIVNLYLGGRPDLAIEKLIRARARDRDFLADLVSHLKYRAHMLYGSMEARSEEYEEAIKQTRLAFSEAGRNVLLRDMALRNLGGIYRIADRWPEAQQVYEGLAQRYPTDAAIHYGLASVYADQLVYTKAEETWRKVVSLLADPSTVAAAETSMLADARMRWGNSLIQAERFDEGWAVLQKFLEANPKSEPVLFWLGHNALERWDDDEHVRQARDWLERAHALDFWCEGPIRELRKVYEVLLPDPAKAKEMARLLEDEDVVKARKKEMEKRKRASPDLTEGCR